MARGALATQHDAATTCAGTMARRLGAPQAPAYRRSPRDFPFRLCESGLSGHFAVYALCSMQSPKSRRGARGIEPNGRCNKLTLAYSDRPAFCFVSARCQQPKPGGVKPLLATSSPA